MRKRIVTALLLISIAAAALPAAAKETVMAEETAAADAGEAAETPKPTPALNWEALVEGANRKLSARLSDGAFTVIDDVAVQMWLPSSLAPVAISGEDEQLGMIRYFEQEGGTAAAAVMYADTDGLPLSEYKAFLEGTAGISGIEELTVNGISALRYALEDMDTICLSLITGGGYALEFTFAPASDEDFASTAKLMMASIQSSGYTPVMPEGADEDSGEAGEEE